MQNTHKTYHKDRLETQCGDSIVAAIPLAR